MSDGSFGRAKNTVTALELSPYSVVLMRVDVVVALDTAEFIVRPICDWSRTTVSIRQFTSGGNL